MKASATIGTALLGVVWIWLVWVLLTSGGFTLKNLLIAVMTGIIIFVPIWKKYFRNRSNN